ncbi:holocytochrome c synthase [Thecaphora frezii]
MRDAHSSHQRAPSSHPAYAYATPNPHLLTALTAYKLAHIQLHSAPSLVAPRASASSGGVPPPSCPMHASSSSSSSSSPPPTTSATSAAASKPVLPPSSAGQCPIPHDQRDAYLASRSGSAPLSEASSSTAAAPLERGGAMARDTIDSVPWSASLNPLNMMPELAQSAAPNQSTVLSTERSVSSIPRSRTSAAPGASPYDAPSACPVPHSSSSASASAAGAGVEEPTKWEYPSPQQFYNALVRKGWETPEEHVETMVLIHNFLNEEAWKQVLEWEKLAGADASRCELARFQGKPGTVSPKARVFGLLGQLMPSRFSSEPPFDRHDWIVKRPDQDGKEVRYVIDYYSVPDDPEKEEPEFVLDVRPALDGWESLLVRTRKTWREFREMQQQQEEKA